MKTYHSREKELYHVVPSKRLCALAHFAFRVLCGGVLCTWDGVGAPWLPCCAPIPDLKQLGNASSFFAVTL